MVVVILLNSNDVLITNAGLIICSRVSYDALSTREIGPVTRAKNKWAFAAIVQLLVPFSLWSSAWVGNAQNVLSHFQVKGKKRKWLPSSTDFFFLSFAGKIFQAQAQRMEPWGNESYSNCNQPERFLTKYWNLLPKGHLAHTGLIFADTAKTC